MGAEVARQWYYPYGETRWSDGTLPTDYQFTGQRAEGFGLYDYHARYYDGAIGRFISADTIVPQPGNPQDFNRYSYVRNSPLVYIDPSGHAQEESGTLPLGGELYWLPTYLDRWYEANPIPPNTTMEVAWHVTWAAQMAYADGVIGYDEFLNVETSAKALPFQDPMVAWAVAADAMQKGFYQYMVAMAMPNLFDMVTGYYDFWTYEGETYPSFNFTPSGSNRIGSRGVQLVAEHMPDVEIGQFRTLDGQRIYDGRLRSTGQYVEIKTSTQGVYYHSGQSPSQVAYDATHGNPVWIFVNCTAGGSLATDLGAANNIAVQTLNVPW